MTTDLDRKIDLASEITHEWFRLIRLYKRARDAREISPDLDRESAQVLSWLQQNYIKIAKDVQSVVSMEFYDPIKGVISRNYDPILQLVTDVGSLSELTRSPYASQYEEDLRLGRNLLNTYNGALDERKVSVGEIKLEDYQRLKSFFEENVRESKRLSAREDLLKGITVVPKLFEVAADYFDEARSCFKYGFFRASTIMAVSALESCLKSDYRRVKGVEYDGKLFTLLNRYFSGDVTHKLPMQYQDFSNTCLKIRNSFTHPKEFDYSESIVFNVLTVVAELVNTIEKFY